MNCIKIIVTNNSKILKEILSQEEEKKTEEFLTSNEIMKLYKKWGRVQSFVENCNRNVYLVSKILSNF